MNKLTITKVYFPMVTVIKVDDGVLSRYYTSTQPGETYPVLEAVETEFEWQDVLAEARAKGARIEVEEFLLQGEKPTLPGKPLPERFRPARPFPRTYGDWLNLGMDIKEKDPDIGTIAQVNNALVSIAENRPDSEEAKRWLDGKAGELGIG